MAQKISVLITGANTGIGLEVVKALYKSSQAYEILVGSRSLEKGKLAISAVEEEISQSTSSLSPVQIDVTSDESIEQAFKQVSSSIGKLDVLVNNAGASFDGEIQKGNLSVREAWNKSWDVNVVGSQVMTNTFLPLLLKSSDPRLLFVTSGTSSLTETERQDLPIFQRLNASPAAGWPKDSQLNPVTSYRSTKTGLNMMVREYCRILKNDGVKIFNISPGFLATGLGGVGVEVLKKVSLPLCIAEDYY